MSNLRDRIAAAIYDGFDDYTKKLVVNPRLHGAGDVEGEWKPVTYALADAVIAELGDWTNWMDTVFVDFGLWLAEEITGRQMTRIDMESCLTDWKADNE